MTESLNNLKCKKKPQGESSHHRDWQNVVFDTHLIWKFKTNNKA